MRAVIYAPLIVFVLICAIFVAQLLSGRDNSLLPSPLIGKPAPELKLEPISSRAKDVLSDDFVKNLDKSYDLIVLNVWASWCVPCRVEHPQITQLSQIDGLGVVGLNYKDEDVNAAAFLSELGDPYLAIGADKDGRVSVEFGVYGVPETFIIDRQGIVRHKHVGPITGANMKEKILPVIEKIRAENAL